ncbi:hypothetical protein L0O83_16355 [Lawsonibacter sp. DFI.5.51]|nr:hypothetical protein [Lawsonibacter sp. DFI.5.51]
MDGFTFFKGFATIKREEIYRAEAYDSEGKLGVNRRSEARTAAKKLWLISEDQ